jgi:hypothetical protein
LAVVPILRDAADDVPIIALVMQAVEMLRKGSDDAALSVLPLLQPASLRYPFEGGGHAVLRFSKHVNEQALDGRGRMESRLPKHSSVGSVAKKKLICYSGEKRAKEVPFMSDHSQHLFKWCHFQSDIILLCVRWYLRYALSYRDLEEMMAERGLEVDHSTIDR